MPAKPALRTELLFYLSFLAAAALLVGVATLLVATSFAPEGTFALVMLMIALEVGVFIVFGRYLVNRLVLWPLERVVAAGDAEGRPRRQRGRTRRAADGRSRPPPGASDRQAGAERGGRRARRTCDPRRAAVGVRAATLRPQASRRPAGCELPAPPRAAARADRFRGGSAGSAAVRRGFRTGCVTRRPREDLRPVLHHQGAGPGDRVGPRHRGARRARYGGCGLGGHGAGGRGGF